jgi:hypothetical protein
VPVRGGRRGERDGLGRHIASEVQQRLQAGFYSRLPAGDEVEALKGVAGRALSYYLLSEYIQQRSASATRSTDCFTPQQLHCTNGLVQEGRQ